MPNKEYVCEFTYIEYTFRYRAIIDKYFFLSVLYVVFAICYAELMRNIVAYHYHLHIRDFIYISRYFLTRIYICIFHKRNHDHFSREQYVVSMARRRS